MILDAKASPVIANAGGGGGAGYICIVSPSVNTTSVVISPPYVAP